MKVATPILLTAVAAISAFAQAPSINSASASQLAFGADGTFTFLHVTDVQERGKLHPRSAAVLRAAIATTKPQLVILTGDNVDSGGNQRESFEKSMGALVAIFKETTTPFCVTFGNHDSERTGEGFLTRQEQYDWFKALTLCSYNDNDPGLRLFVVHPDGSFETEIGSEKHPFPMLEEVQE